MNEDKKSFLQVLSKCVNNEFLEFDENLWQIFDMYAPKHALLTFIVDNLCRNKQNISEKIRLATQIIILKNYRCMMVQQDVISLLTKSGIKCAVLKGGSVAVNYPNPMYRAFGDVDILVNENDYAKAISVLSGEEHDNSESNSHEFHWQIVKNDVVVEIHKAVTGYINKNYMKKVSCAFDTALNRLLTSNIDDICFPVLDYKYQAASLCLHMQRHFFDNELNLRMLCDWALFVKNIDDSVWNGEVRDFLADLNLEKFASGITAVCNKYLSIHCENKQWHDFSSELEEHLIDEFFCGIGERKVSLSQNLGQLFGRNHINKFASFFLAFNTIVKKKYSFAKKSPVLLSIAWLCALVSYIVRSMLGRANKIDASVVNTYYDKRRVIFDQLGIKGF